MRLLLLALVIAVPAAATMHAQSPATPVSYRVAPDTFWNTLDHRHPVVRRIKPGDVISTKTLDASGYDDKDVQRAASGNPMIGPLFVEGPDAHVEQRTELRAIAFGVLTSHTRTHGAPPREPWEYDEAMVTDFRRAVELKYALMPYVYAEAQISSARGWPMLRTLSFEHPDDQTSWLVEDEYMFGSSLLVAPLFDETTTRQVYLPPGTWIDYQTRRVYEGARWHAITAGAIPIVLLVKNHTALPHLAVAQSTSAMNWSDVELRIFSTDAAPATGSFARPGEGARPLRVEGARLVTDPLPGRVKWRITR